MAYKEHGMWEVLDVLRRAHRGEGRRAIARTTGRSRKIVQRYLTAAADLGWQPGQDEPGEPLAAQILAQLRPSEAEQRLLPHRETLRGWLSGAAAEGHPLTLTKCHALLTRRGVAVTYSSLYRFAVKHCGIGERPSTVRVAEVAPGELAEVDFGRLGLIPDGRLDRRRVLWALVITLVHSRHQYVHLSHSQTLADVLSGLEDAWTFFGGVPARVVVDNLRAAIAKANRYDPIFARVFEEYSRHLGFVIDPAPPAMPTGKPHVERQVPYVREHFFRGETFLDRDHAQREAIHWCVDTAGRRLHGTTQQRPLEVFEAVERPAPRPQSRRLHDPLARRDLPLGQAAPGPEAAAPRRPLRRPDPRSGPAAARSRPGRHRSRPPRGPGDPGHAAFPTPVRQLCSPPDRHGGILMDITNSLKAVLKRLRLSPILQTLVDRLV